MADGGDLNAAELRVKYDATTRLLAAQCDTIERLHGQVQALQQRQPPQPDSTTTPWRHGEGKENVSDDHDNGDSSWGGEASDAGGGGFEPKYRRAKRLVRMQVRPYLKGGRGVGGGGTTKIRVCAT